MASRALVPLYAGFSYDMTVGKIGFAPRMRRRPFVSFFSVGEAWGQVAFRGKTFTLTVTEGKRPLATLALPNAHCVRSLTVDGSPVPFTVAEGQIHLASPVTVYQSVTVESK